MFAAGSALSSISIGSLKEIKISEAMCKDAEDYNKGYAEKYRNLRKLRKRLKEQTDKTKNMFDKDLNSKTPPPAEQDK